MGAIKRNILFGLILVSFLSLLITTVVLDDRYDPFAIRFVIQTPDGTEQINVYTNEDREQFLFIPSCGKDNLHVYFDFDRISVNGKEFRSGDALTGIGTDQPQTVVCFKNGKEKAAREIRFMQAKNIPSVHIQSLSGKYLKEKDKSEKQSCQIRIYDPESRTEYTGTSDQIRGHGNSTWGYPKKSYNLYLESEADILSMGGVRNGSC